MLWESRRHARFIVVEERVATEVEGLVRKCAILPVFADAAVLPERLKGAHGRLETRAEQRGMQGQARDQSEEGARNVGQVDSWGTARVAPVREKNAEPACGKRGIRTSRIHSALPLRVDDSQRRAIRKRGAAQEGVSAQQQSLGDGKRLSALCALGDRRHALVVPRVGHIASGTGTGAGRRELGGWRRRHVGRWISGSRLALEQGRPTVKM